MRHFPEAIIRGMMMAIGLIVILKQTFVLLGFKAPRVSMIEAFGEIPHAILGMQIETFLIGIFVILLIFFWRKYFEKYKTFKAISVYLVAIIFSSIIAYVFHISDNRHYLMEVMAQPVSALFVSLPNSTTGIFSFPNFGKFWSYQFAISVFTIFAVGSLEHILSAIAVDKLDPLNRGQKRPTNLKKDLRAVGLGNLLCGSIGALPMIAEIVRGSANVKYGATNKWSNFFHGLCLLVMITIFNGVLKFIPLCVLAGMLIMIGWNLMNFKLFSKIFRKHSHNFLIIMSVVFFTLYIDLLVGISSGVIIHLVAQRFFRKRSKIIKIGS